MRSDTPLNYRGLASQNLNHWENYCPVGKQACHFTCGNLSMFGPEVLGWYHSKGCCEPNSDLLSNCSPSDRDGMIWSALALWENSRNSTEFARLLCTGAFTWPFSFLSSLEKGTAKGWVCKGWIFRERKTNKTLTSCKNLWLGRQWLALGTFNSVFSGPVTRTGDRSQV